MAPPLVSPFSRTLHFLRKHPVVSCLLLLPLSPPIYRVILYFSPLFLSTALCIFALISITPYVTATGAEVQRQSMLGATSHLKKTSTTSATSVCVNAELSCDGKLHPIFALTTPSSSSALSLSCISSSSVVSTSAVTALCPSIPANSWLSWMKGLNDIGRTWMESQLKEQGLALSEPANRETLMSLIEGSFAELVTMKDQSVELFMSMDTTAQVEGKCSSADVLETLSFKCEVEEARQVRGMYQGFPTEEGNEGGAFLGPNAEMINTAGDGYEGSKGPLPASTIQEHTAPIKETADAFALKQEDVEYTLAVEVTPSLPELNATDMDVKSNLNDSILSKSSHMLETEAVSLMPRTPSKISALSKRTEPSKRIFSKEEDVKAATVTSSPSLVLNMSGQQPLKPSAGNASNQNKSAPPALKLPTKTLLGRSRSVTGKDGGKLATSRSLGEVSVAEYEENGAAEAAKRKTVDYHRDVVRSTKESFVVGHLEDCDVAVSDDQGPKFDEGLEIEEVQALVRSELMMLDMEIDELASRLPKLDQYSADYERTPVRRQKAGAATSTPTTPVASIRSTTLLFGSPIFK